MRDLVEAIIPEQSLCGDDELSHDGSDSEQMAADN